MKKILQNYKKMLKRPKNQYKNINLQSITLWTLSQVKTEKSANLNKSLIHLSISNNNELEDINTNTRTGISIKKRLIITTIKLKTIRLQATEIKQSSVSIVIA